MPKIQPPLHPGEVLKEEFLVPLDLSANKLARDIDVPVNRITEIVNRKRAVTADTALRLGRYFGMSAEFWIGLQTSYDLEIARDAHGAAIERRVQPRSKRAA